MTDEQLKQLWEDLKDICNIESMDAGRANRIAHVFGALSDEIAAQKEEIKSHKMKYENTGSMFGRQNQRMVMEENERLRKEFESLTQTIRDLQKERDQ